MKQERESPVEIIGRQVLVVMNLAPRGMMGELSEGMLFDIGDADAITPLLAVPEGPVPNGARAGCDDRRRSPRPTAHGLWHAVPIPCGTSRASCRSPCEQS